MWPIVVIIRSLLRLLGMCRFTDQTLSGCLSASQLAILDKAIIAILRGDQACHNILIVFYSSELFKRWSWRLCIFHTFLHYSKERLSRAHLRPLSACALCYYTLVTLIEITPDRWLLYSSRWRSAYESSLVQIGVIVWLHRSYWTPLLFLFKVITRLLLCRNREAFNWHLRFVSTCATNVAHVVFRFCYCSLS